MSRKLQDRNLENIGHKSAKRRDDVTPKRNFNSSKKQNDEIRRKYDNNMVSRFNPQPKRSQMQQKEKEPGCSFSPLLSTAEVADVNGIKYLKLAKIGKGTKSDVYKVVSDSGSFYALKEVKLSPRDHLLRKNYENEVEILQMMRGNDRIIHLIDSEITTKSVKLILELGETDLKQVIEKKNKLCPNFLRYTWQQMLEAINTIHESNIIHGDLKPSNFVLVKGTLKLIDFGIAKVLDDDATSAEICAPAEIHQYRAPETLMPQHRQQEIKLRRSADVWSIGCILYELVHGKSPLPTRSFKAGQAIMNVANERHRISFPKIDSPDVYLLRDVLSQCLQKNPTQRPTIEELLQHNYISHPSSSFVVTNISIAENLRQFANDIKRNYSDCEFRSEGGAKILETLAMQLVNGRKMKIPLTVRNE